MPTAVAVIHHEDGNYGVSFPDFPGCVTAGRTIDEALRKGEEALSFHVAGMIEDGLDLPVPSDVVDPEGGMLAVVRYEVEARPVRVNISIDQVLLRLIDRAAEAEGTSRSAFLAEAAKKRLQQPAH